MQLSKSELEMIEGTIDYFITRGKELKLDEDFSHYVELKNKIINMAKEV